MNIERQVALLFANALKENRLDITDALTPFLSIDGLVNYLYDNPEKGYTEQIAKSLIKHSYSKEEVNLMGRHYLIDIREYERDYLKFGSNKNIDESSRVLFIRNYMSMGYYKAATEGIATLDEPQVFIDSINTDINKMSARNNEFAFAFVGEPQKWDSYAIDIFNKIGFTIGDGLKHFYPKNDALWSSSRFEEQVNGLGDYLKSISHGTPEAKLDGSRLSFSSGELLAEAFRREHAELNSDERAGGWNCKNFPQYLPVIASDEVRAAIESMGGVHVVADTHGENEDGNKYIGHRFLPDGDQISNTDVAMAMTLLPLTEISRLLEMSDKNIMLVPAYAIQPSRVEVSNELANKMLWHRPEVIRIASNDENRLSHNLCQFGLSPMLYLRGADVFSERGYGKLDMRPGKNFNKMETLRHFSTEYEKEMGREKWCELHFVQSGDDVNAEKERFYKEIAEVTEYFGKEPEANIVLRYPLFESLALDDRKFKVGNIYEFNESKAENYISRSICSSKYISKYPRLSARIGADPVSNAEFFGEKLSDIIAKAVRIKPDNEMMPIAMGLLDRYDVNDVISAARTDRQIDFVIDALDLNSGSVDLSSKSDIDPKIKRKIAKRMVSDSMEL